MIMIAVITQGEFEDKIIEIYIILHNAYHLSA